MRPQMLFPRLLILSMLFTVLTSKTGAQGSVDPARDGVPEANATAGHAQYVKHTKKHRKRASDWVKFNIDQLQDVLQKCENYHLTEVEFIIASLTKDLAPHYASRHPELSPDEIKDLKNRHVLLIKVPKNIFEKAEQSGAYIGTNKESFLVSLQSVGLIKLDKPYNIKPMVDYIYLDIGIICPPPNVCN